MEPHPAIPGLYTWDTQQDLEQLRAAVRTLFDGSSETRGHSRRRMSACKEFGVEFSSAEKEGKYTVNELNLRNPAHAVIAKFIAGELARHEGDVIEQSGATVVPCNLLSTNVVIRRYRPGQSIGFHTDRVDKFDDLVWSVVVECGEPEDGIHFEFPDGHREPVRERPGLVTVQSNACRRTLKHGVTSVQKERISITWRFFLPRYLETLSGYPSLANANRLAGFVNAVAEARKAAERRPNDATTTAHAPTRRAAQPSAAGPHSSQFSAPAPRAGMPAGRSQPTDPTHGSTGVGLGGQTRGETRGAGFPEPLEASTLRTRVDTWQQPHAHHTHPHAAPSSPVPANAPAGGAPLRPVAVHPLNRPLRVGIIASPVGSVLVDSETASPGGVNLLGGSGSPVSSTGMGMLGGAGTSHSGFGRLVCGGLVSALATRLCTAVNIVLCGELNNPYYDVMRRIVGRKHPHVSVVSLPRRPLTPTHGVPFAVAADVYVMVEGGFEAALLAREAAEAGKPVLRLGCTGGAASDWFGLMTSATLHKPAAVEAVDWACLQNSTATGRNGMDTACMQVLRAALNAVCAITGVAPKVSPDAPKDDRALLAPEMRSPLGELLVGSGYHEPNVVTPPFQLSLMESTKGTNPWTRPSSDEWAAMGIVEGNQHPGARKRKGPAPRMAPVGRPVHGTSTKPSVAAAAASGHYIASSC